MLAWIESPTMLVAICQELASSTHYNNWCLNNIIFGCACLQYVECMFCRIINHHNYLNMSCLEYMVNLKELPSQPYYGEKCSKVFHLLNVWLKQVIKNRKVKLEIRIIYDLNANTMPYSKTCIFF